MVVDRARLLCDAASRERVLVSEDTVPVATTAAREDQAAALALIAAAALPDPHARHGSVARPGDAAGLTTFADDVVRLVEVGCGDADEARTLAVVCDLVRQQVGACTVAVSALKGGDSPLASAGSKRCLDPVAIRRAVEGGLTRPLRPDSGHFVTAPIKEGSRALAVLVACWRTEAVDDVRTDAWPLLSIAAALCVPDVRALLDRRRPEGSYLGRGLLGRSPEMAALRRAVERAAASPFPVLIEGETGSGKEVVAGELHRLSARRAGAFCAVNCAALTDELFEAELFGHARGAFTGAVADRAGLFEEADGGTLFLDEVGELSPRAQAKLLRALQAGEIRRVGENRRRRLDVHVVAATNCSLAAQVDAGRFRRDLWYRLDVVRLEVPPLRARCADIALLATHFWHQALDKTGGRATLAAETLAALSRYRWPGNVRQLQNIMAALAVGAPRRGRVGPTALPAAVRGRTYEPPVTLAAARIAFDRQYVGAALGRAAGQPARAARELGLTRQGLAKLIKRLDPI